MAGIEKENKRKGELFIYQKGCWKVMLDGCRLGVGFAWGWGIGMALAGW